MAEIYVPENVEFLTNWNGFELPKGILNKGGPTCQQQQQNSQRQKQEIDRDKRNAVAIHILLCFTQVLA